LILVSPRAGRKEVVGAATAAMVRKREGSEELAETGWLGMAPTPQFLLQLQTSAELVGAV
jgi:hypothetical protein